LSYKWIQSISMASMVVDHFQKHRYNCVFILQVVLEMDLGRKLNIIEKQSVMKILMYCMLKFRNYIFHTVLYLYKNHKWLQLTKVMSSIQMKNENKPLMIITFMKYFIIRITIVVQLIYERTYDNQSCNYIQTLHILLHIHTIHTGYKKHKVVNSEIIFICNM
jgi:hypothetical protein